MKKLRIYLDTSVISHLDALDVPEKMADTQGLWDEMRAGKYDIVVSTATINELNACPEPKRTTMINYLGQLKYEQFALTAETVRIAQQFVEQGILGTRHIMDRLHLAAALASGCDIIVSWNFKHIVNHRTIYGVKIVAAITGYRDLMIFTPTILVEGDENHD